jgi:tRNA pseudouridine38-40 synthase
VTTRNLRLDLAYDGTRFYGWQRQCHKPTIQGCIEDALEKILGTKIMLTGSGRTDAGVHASNQVANFKTDSAVPSPNLQRALNNVLPSSIRVIAVADVPMDFHARLSAQAKTYRYRILQQPVCPPFISRFVHHYPYPLDHSRMKEAAKYIQGEHDFTSFAAVPRRIVVGRQMKARPGGRRSAVRSITRSRTLWRPRNSLLVYEITGGGFLHHMVRNIVGTLIEVGRGKIAPREIPRILEARDRARAGPTAPACGLCLVKVEY